MMFSKVDILGLLASFFFKNYAFFYLTLFNLAANSTYHLVCPHDSNNPRLSVLFVISAFHCRFAKKTRQKSGFPENVFDYATRSTTIGGGVGRRGASLYAFLK